MARSDAAPTAMTGTVRVAISDEQVLQANSLASVTRNFMVIRDSARPSWTIIPLSRLSKIELIKSPHPGLLVISSGLFVLAAAAFSSKEGDGAGTPLTLLGLFVLIAYAASRKASVTFILDSGAAVTVTGSVTEAIALVALVELIW
jgi:hypothetical protein